MTNMNHPVHAGNPERKALMLSVIGSACMAALGIGFALFTNSLAVLLDGIFSLFGLGIALLGLGVSRIVQRPDDRYFQFGYGAVESFFNFSKGLLIAGITMFVLVTSVLSIMKGGRPVSTGYVSLYATIIAIICFVIAIKQSVMSRRLGSLLVKVDAKNWMLDGIISIGVAVGFFTATLLSKTRLSWIVPYADPIIVILILLGTAYVPVLIIGENVKHLLLRAPAAGIQEKANKIITTALSGFPVESKRLRIVQVGRYLYLHLIVVVLKKGSPVNIEVLDTIRDRVFNAVTEGIQNSDIDVYFTLNKKWTR